MMPRRIRVAPFGQTVVMIPNTVPYRFLQLVDKSHHLGRKEGSIVFLTNSSSSVAKVQFMTTNTNMHVIGSGILINRGKSIA